MKAVRFFLIMVVCLMVATQPLSAAVIYVVNNIKASPVAGSNDPNNIIFVQAVWGSADGVLGQGSSQWNQLKGGEKCRIDSGARNFAILAVQKGELITRKDKSGKIVQGILPKNDKPYFFDIPSSRLMVDGKIAVNWASEIWINFNASGSFSGDFVKATLRR